MSSTVDGPTPANSTPVIHVRVVDPAAADIGRVVPGLVEVLVDCVDGGASVSSISDDRALPRGFRR